jgi:hypothetical protein
MTNATNQSIIAKVSARRLGMVYTYILSLPSLKDKPSSPITDPYGSETTKAVVATTSGEEK